MTGAAPLQEELHSPISAYGGSAIGITGGDASDGAFHQEKPHLAKAD
jgi:hypothetical protein